MPSSGAASATWQSTAPVAGSSTGRVAPDFAGRHDPPMNSPVGSCSTTRVSSLGFLVMAAIVPSQPPRRTPRRAFPTLASHGGDVRGWADDRRQRPPARSGPATGGAAAAGRRPAGRGAGVPGGGTGGRLVGPAPGRLAHRVGRAVQRRAGPARLAGHDDPGRVRRSRGIGPGSLCGHRGAARGRCAGGRALDRGPADRPVADALRHRGPAPALPARASPPARCSSGSG